MVEQNEGHEDFSPNIKTEEGEGLIKGLDQSDKPYNERQEGVIEAAVDLHQTGLQFDKLPQLDLLHKGARANQSPAFPARAADIILEPHEK